MAGARLSIHQIRRVCRFLFPTCLIIVFICFSRTMPPLQWSSDLLMLGSTTNSRMLLFALLTWRCKWISQWIGPSLTFHNSYYKALTFYLQEQPTLLTDLLTVLIPRIDHSRVVRMFSQIDHIPLIRSYLIAVQQVRNMFVACVFASSLIILHSPILKQSTTPTTIFSSRRKTTKHFETRLTASITLITLDLRND